MASLNQHWINGEPGSAVAVSDRGFAYGDGVFETLRFYRSEFLFRNEHLQRMSLGAKRLGIDWPEIDVSGQLDQVSGWLCAEPVEEALVRIQLTRGSNVARGKPGGYGGVAGSPTVVASVYSVPYELDARLSDAAVGVCSVKLAEQPLLAGIKHCNRLEQVLAAKEVQSHSWDNGVMLSQSDRVVSMVNGNLFARIDGSWVTPPIDKCGIAGIVREIILEDVAPHMDMSVKVEDLSLADIYSAQELYMTNSVVGVQGLALVDGESLTNGDVSAIHEAYKQVALERCGL